MENIETMALANQRRAWQIIEKSGILDTVAIVLGVLLALLIFIAIPQWITGFLPFA